METEYTITGKIFFADAPRNLSPDFEFDGHTITIKSCDNTNTIATLSLKDVAKAQSLSEDTLEQICHLLSQRYHCKAYLCKGAETYGNANVFNGGSDYEIIHETWFLCACDNGQIILRESTNHWNEKIDHIAEILKVISNSY